MENNFVLNRIFSLLNMPKELHQIFICFATYWPALVNLSVRHYDFSPEHKIVEIKLGKKEEFYYHTIELTYHTGTKQIYYHISDEALMDLEKKELIKNSSIYNLCDPPKTIKAAKKIIDDVYKLYKEKLDKAKELAA